MIIRKIFELIESNFYQKIDKWPNKYLRIISEKDRDKLIEMFPKFRKPIQSEKSSMSKIICGKGKERIDIDVMIDDDEWFYIRIIKKNIYGRNIKYYKCDQFEGIVDFLKKEVIRENRRLDSFYEKIDSVKWKSNENKKELYQEDKDKLIKTFPQLKYAKQNFYQCKRFIYQVNISHFVNIDIKTDDDEWFYVRISITAPRWIIVKRSTLYYKCDQFEGLVELIKNEIINF